MIIKCPECGHQVSDKAPVCPSCGVEIAGHIIKCSNCGEIYLNDEETCPHCHCIETQTNPHTTAISIEETLNVKQEELPSEAIHTVASVSEGTNTTPTKPITVAVPITAQVVEPQAIKEQEDTTFEETAEAVSKHSHKSFFIAVTIAILTGIILLFTYKKTNSNTELQAYELALKSNDTTLLKQYLEDFPQASTQHRTMIMALLKKESSLTNTDNWQDILKSNTREAYQQYLSAHPNTTHKAEITLKLDELDWQKAATENTEKAYLDYVSQYPTGIHKAEAEEKLKAMLIKTASIEDQARAIACVRQLLIGINTRSKDKISSAVAPRLNFQGASEATAKDIIKYMNDKLYQADVNTVNWHLGSTDEVISTVGTDSSIQIKMPAKLVIDRKEGKGSKNYLVKAAVKWGRITQISWN